jgi:hypothetical protein
MLMQSSKKELSLRGLALAAVVVSIAAASGCGGSSSSKNNNNNTQVIASPGPNVSPITEDFGPTQNYLNGVFVSVNVCVPGTSTCQTIDHVLLDTGSIGLRLLDSSSQGKFSSAQVPLPQEKDSSNNPVARCVQFVDGSFLWGRVATADVKMSGETASSVPVHIVGDTTFTASNPVPSPCAMNGTNADTLASLGANGILGVGNLQPDCPGCAPGANPSAPDPYYYTCPGGVCSPAFVTVAQQVQNPVASFPTDNNGVIVELPPVGATGAVSVTTGVLVFGIGTQTNNGLGSASVLTLDQNLFLTASYKGTSYPQSYIDSGSNAYFLLDGSSITVCPNISFFYCPSSTQNLTATNQGMNGTSTSVNFSIANLESLPAANWIFNNVGGPNSASQTFDWGAPFFMGRNVFFAIQGKTAPGGTPPYVAY